MTKEEWRWVKAGTMPGFFYWVKLPEGGVSVGDKIRFREGQGPWWAEATVWQIGPPPDYRLYVEL